MTLVTDERLSEMYKIVSEETTQNPFHLPVHEVEIKYDKYWSKILNYSILVFNYLFPKKIALVKLVLGWYYPLHKPIIQVFRIKLFPLMSFYSSNSHFLQVAIIFMSKFAYRMWIWLIEEHIHIQAFNRPNYMTVSECLLSFYFFQSLLIIQLLYRLIPSNSSVQNNEVCFSLFGTPIPSRSMITSEFC